MKKTITIKSSLFLASIDGALFVYENVEATHEEVLRGRHHCKNLFQRWSKNDGDLSVVYREFDKVVFKCYGQSTRWLATRGKDVWDWESRPLDELRREAAVARERKALDRCTVKAPARSRQGGRL